MKQRSADAAIVILAGGLATRFPGKLERSLHGVSLLQRVCRNARATGLPAYIAGSEQFSPAIAADCDLPMLVDRWPGGGPLRALYSACASIDQERVFALAADEPLVGPELIASLAGAWQPGDEAVVPRHDDRIEPLAALYLRAAVLREVGALLASGNEAMGALISRIGVRFVTLSQAYFVNVNTPADLRRVARGAR
jgi:molybdopterin-guanine dinucleotide biosynthesis protein A